MADEPRLSTEPGKEEISFLKEAFNSQYNWIAMAGAAAFALLSASPLVLLLGAGLELMYLSFVPQQPRFQRLVRARKFAEEKRDIETRLRAMVVTLPADMLRRYENLQGVCAGIRANYAQLSATSQIFARQMEERLDGLLQGFLRLLVAVKQHSDYLGTASPDAIRRAMAGLENAMAVTLPKVQEINKRRIEILQKRLEKFDKIRENSQVISAQCSAIEDVLALIRDQSVTMKDPQQVSDQLGSLVRDVEQTEEAVQQVEAIFELTAPDIGISLSQAEAGSTPPQAPSKTRTPVGS